MMKNYSEAIDIWSLGCVLGEMMLNRQNGTSVGKKLEDKYLFPGQSCFPLSPDFSLRENRNRSQAKIISSNDQIRKIVEQMGK
jgi:serine/threonine protein kinase